MAEHYKYKIDCSNCGARTIKNGEYGNERPERDICSSCGTYQKTSIYREDLPTPKYGDFHVVSGNTSVKLPDCISSFCQCNQCRKD